MKLNLSAEVISDQNVSPKMAEIVGNRRKEAVVDKINRISVTIEQVLDLMNDRFSRNGILDVEMENYKSDMINHVRKRLIEEFQVLKRQVGDL